MIGLLRSETLRIRSRRLVWILAVLALAGIALGVVIAAVKSHPPSATEVALARRAYLVDLRGCLQGQVSPDSLNGKTVSQFCHDAISPAEALARTTFALAKLPDILRGTAFLLIVLGLVIGASSTGADWQTGSMTTLLTWEPRRARVLVMRTTAVGATVFLLIVALSLALSLLLWLVAATRGTTVGTDSVWLKHVAGLILRIAIMGGLGAILGLSISMIGRGTAAALGAIFVYLAVLETLFRSLVPKLTPYLFATNTVVFVDGHAGSPATATVITMTRATITVFAYAAALLFAAWVFFRSRDVS